MVYLVATVTGSRRLLRGSSLVTLPFLRRALDALAVVSVAASAIGTAGTAANAASVPTGAPASHTLQTPRQASALVGAAAPGKGAPAHVSGTAVGRHFPHPGRAPHLLPHHGP